VKKEESISKECVNLLNDTSRKMTNPLLQKYEELYGKKEPPKMPRIEDYEGEETIADEIKGTQIGYTYTDEITKPRKLAKCYDPNELKECFIKTAFEVKTGIAQIISMNMEMDTMGIYSAGAKITFEVYVRKF
jgi:hypothetical protein